MLLDVPSGENIGMYGLRVRGLGFRFRAGDLGLMSPLKGDIGLYGVLRSVSRALQENR